MNKEKETKKIKPLTQAEMLLAIDRLTRFKPPAVKYNRVFKDIISKNLISPKISFKDYEKLSAQEVKKLAEEIFEASLRTKSNDNSTIEIITNLENQLFNIDKETEILLQTKIPYKAILENNTKPISAPNLILLSKIIETGLSPTEIRKKFLTKFPIEKIVLAEGITEEILLPKFAKITGYDFNKEGIEVIPAGGKNQVAKEYIKLKNIIKAPVIVLLDADAKSIAEIISKHLREKDKLILIQKGEFEDILSLKLLKKAINYKFINIFSISISDFSTNTSRVKDLEEIYRKNGLGEFKKAEFANLINKILKDTDTNLVTDEIKNIIEEIKQA